MSEIPEWLLLHEVTFEDWLGVNGNGEDQYADPVTLACYIEQSSKLVRDRTTGDQKVSGTQVWIQLRPTAPTTEARVTFASGELADLLEVKTFDGGGLETPDHHELMCL